MGRLLFQCIRRELTIHPASGSTILQVLTFMTSTIAIDLKVWKFSRLWVENIITSSEIHGKQQTSLKREFKS